MSLYRDRREAGRVLASKLSKYAGRNDVTVLALPRGGVPVAYEVARHLGAPLDVFVVRKLGFPGYEELAIGALASGGVIVLDTGMVEALDIPESTLNEIVATEMRELLRREKAYRGDRPPLDVAGRTVILLDDGLATGSTMRAAVAGLKQLRPKQIVVAVPIAAPSTCELLAREVDDIVCGATPEPFRAVGLWYQNFSQTTDEEVRALLEAASREQAGHPDASAPAERP
jgi:predicted phosphoribosyltransferase